MSVSVNIVPSEMEMVCLNNSTVYVCRREFGNQAFPEMPRQSRKFRNCMAIKENPGISGNA